MQLVIATSSSCIGAASTYILSGKIIWPVTIALLLRSVTGSQIGVRIAEKMKPRLVKPLLRIILVALLIQVTFDHLSF